METIRQVLDAKGGEVWSISPATTVYDALTLMAEKHVGALLVMDGDRLAGIVSERDYARKVVLLDRMSRDTPVSDIMTPEVLVMGPGDTVDHGLALMTERRIRHLPVVEDGNVVGVISIGDLVKAVISEQQFKIEQLERYIAG